jgi:hypothetical protein
MLMHDRRDRAGADPAQLPRAANLRHRLARWYCCKRGAKAVKFVIQMIYDASEIGNFGFHRGNDALVVYLVGALMPLWNLPTIGGGIGGGHLA